MESSIPIGRRQCGEKKILVEVKYTIKARQINLSTFIYTVGVTLVDGNKNMDHWVLQFLVPISHHLRYSFITFRQRLIRTVLITDSVLDSIGALELMKFQNKIDQHDITVKENAELDDLRKSMFSMGVTILEHDDIYHCSTSDHEPELVMFRYKDENKYFISDKVFSRELGSVYISGVRHFTMRMTYESQKNGFSSVRRITWGLKPLKRASLLQVCLLNSVWRNIVA